MNVPKELFYTKDHEWLKIEDNTFTIGITDFAQGELGDIVFMELPELNINVNNGDSVGTIEAVKTVADVYTPISGEIIDVNLKLEDEPELINNDPYEKGWIVKIKSESVIDSDEFLSDKDYIQFIEE